MKKLILILVVVAMAAPLYAAGRVQFSATDNWDGSCTIVYDANDTFGVAPVAMGLTVKVTSGNPITKVVLEDENDFMEIYMDAAYSMDPCYTYGAGTAIADPCGPGEVSLTTHGNHFVLSFGGLGGEFAKTKAPPMSGTITLYADTGAPGTSGTIKLDPRRGGVIGEDGEPMETNLDDPAKAGPMAFTINECYREADAASAWYPFGKPKCFCYPRQCHGDAEGTKEGSPFGGYYWIGVNDLNILAAAWMVKEPPKASEPYPNGIVDVVGPGVCADYDHTQEGSPFGGYYRVGVGDLNILAAAWMAKDPPKNDPQHPVYPNGVPADCIPNSVEIDPATGQPI